MPRKPQPWFRFYVETMSDRKIRRLTPAERWVWAAVMSAARESPTPGRLLIAADEPMTVEDLADYADVPKKVTAAALDKARRFGMVHDEADVMVVTNFGRRQFESDVSTTRTRTHRERSNEQGRNVPTSSDGTDVGTSPSRARPTETETETEKASEPRKRGVRLADDWKPTEQDVAWQRERGISDLLARREFEKFGNYWRAKSGRDAAKLDWSATWRNWLLTAKEREPARRDEDDPMGWAR